MNTPAEQLGAWIRFIWPEKDPHTVNLLFNGKPVDGLTAASILKTLRWQHKTSRLLRLFRASESVPSVTVEIDGDCFPVMFDAEHDKEERRSSNPSALTPPEL